MSGANVCLAIPGKIIKISGKKAKIFQKNHSHWIDLSLVEDVKVGDYLICQSNFALNKVESLEAEKILKLNLTLEK